MWLTRSGVRRPHYVHRAGRCGRAGIEGTVHGPLAICTASPPALSPSRHVIAQVVSIVPPGRAFVVSKLTRQLGVPLTPLMVKGGKLIVDGGSAARTASAAGRGRDGRRRTPSATSGAGGRSKAGRGGGKGSGMAATTTPRAPKVKRGYPRPLESGRSVE